MPFYMDFKFKFNKKINGPYFTIKTILTIININMSNSGAC